MGDYDSGLVDAPDFTTGVVCPFPSGKVWETVWSCYKNEAPGSGPALVIRSDCDWEGVQTTGRVVQAGANKEEMWSFTGADNQLWKWSESGNMLINVATGKPFAVGGFTEWRVRRPMVLSCACRPICCRPQSGLSTNHSCTYDYSSTYNHSCAYNCTHYTCAHHYCFCRFRWPVH